jgi:hypothetical protein
MIVKGFKNFCISDEMRWMEWRMRKKLKMLAVNVRHDGNCEDNAAETDDRNGEWSETGEAE